MRVTVFGLGYVGTVSCACLCKDGFDVTGVDLNPTKVGLINAGKSPIVEELIGDMIATAVKAGRLRATTDAAEGGQTADVLMISVGTPSQANGGIDLTALRRVCTSIGQIIAGRTDHPLVVVRSTVMPGTIRQVVIPLLEQVSGKACKVGFGICFNPEFLRESSSVRDYYDPPFSLLGADDRADGQRAAQLYQAVEAPVIHTGIETAEMVKYVGNALHALKVTFGNEIGIVAQALGVDSHEVMSIACRDTKLNISPRYLKPGFAFGGSCLPKDVRALVQTGRQHDLDLPLLNGVLTSNRWQVQRAVDLVVQQGRRKVALLGLSFKAGTDDLRESPLVTLAEALIGKGFDVAIYDRSISLTRLLGANKEHIDKELPHLASVLSEDLRAVVAAAEVVVVGNASPEFDGLPGLCRPGQIVIDLVRIDSLRGCAGIDYRGIAW
jgi:GDP-mannose 6-dehydrogenase